VGIPPIPRPLYMVSLEVTLLLYEVMFAVAVVFDVLILYVALAATLLPLVALIFWLPYSVYALRGIKKARNQPAGSVFFWEDSVRVKGRGTDAEFRYSYIKDVKKLGRSLRWPNERVLVVKRDGELLILPNPRNDFLKMDLYSWLLSKTGNHAA